MLQEDISFFPLFYVAAKGQEDNVRDGSRFLLSNGFDFLPRLRVHSDEHGELGVASVFLHGRSIDESWLYCLVLFSRKLLTT